MARAGYRPTEALRGVHVVVVHHDPVARELLTTILRYGGALVTAVPSAPAALRRLRLIRADALVVGLGLPRQSGYGLIRRLRPHGSAEGARVPAVALGRRGVSGERARALASGFDGYLPEPVSPWALGRLLAGLLRES